MKVLKIVVLVLLVTALYGLCAFASVNQIKPLHALALYLLTVASFVLGLVTGE